MSAKTTPFDPAEFLTTPEVVDCFLANAYESGDSVVWRSALYVAARSEGMRTLAKNETYLPPKSSDRAPAEANARAALNGMRQAPHDQAITDEDARRVGIEPLSVYQIATQACCDRMEEAGWPAIEPDTTERVEATSITINLAAGMATDVALMHVITRAAVMLGAGPRDWDAMLAWLRERELPK